MARLSDKRRFPLQRRRVLIIHSTPKERNWWMIGSMEIYMVFHAAYLVLSGILFAFVTISPSVDDNKSRECALYDGDEKDKLAIAAVSVLYHRCESAV